MTERRFAPAGPLRGTLTPPPDKSISHRAALVAAMSGGEVPIANYLNAADTLSTLAAARALGCDVATAPAGDGAALNVTVCGRGLLGAREPGAAIDVGNAGTLLRLLPGWLAGQAGRRFTLDGDQSIRRRPVDRIVEPLSRMGGRIGAREGRLPPLAIEGAELRGIEYRLPVASAQVKSCVLLAGLLADGRTAVVEPATTRDHTERMLGAAGVPVAVERAGGGSALEGARIAVEGVEGIDLPPVRVPGDLSSAAFWMVAATVVHGSEIRLTDVGLNPTRAGLLGVLDRMGASVEVDADAGGSVGAGEPRGEIVVRSAPLHATSVAAEEVPLLIDELPLVALAGCFATGETVVSGAGELRHKESDRIATVVEGLRGIGADIEATPDGFVVRGAGGIAGGVVDAAADHRIAMLGAVAGLVSRQGVVVRGIEAAGVSYPAFGADLGRLAGGA